MKAFIIGFCVAVMALMAGAISPAVAKASKADQQAAVAVVKAIYDSTDVAWGRDVFTSETAAMFTEAEAVDEMGLGFDPFIDGQDFDLTQFQYSSEATQTGVQVRARFLNMGEARDIRFDMVKTDQGWKIDDITSHDETGEKWRLTALLSSVIEAGARRLAAESFVRGIYVSATEVAPREGRLTPELSALFTEAEAADDVGLNFNPFVDADRAEIKDIRFGSWLTDEGAFVEVEFTNIIRTVHLVYEMTETDGNWRIADIVALSEGREKWRLSTLLRYIIDHPVRAAS